jgi:hypothetical protein
MGDDAAPGGLLMSRESTLARGRTQAEERMTDTCKVGAKIRSETLNDQGLYAETIDPVYEGICEVQFGANQPNTSDAGAQIVTVQDVVLKLPVTPTTGLVSDEHFAEITGSVNDPGLIGRVFRITGFNAKTYSTARRFPVELES